MGDLMVEVVNELNTLLNSGTGLYMNAATSVILVCVCAWHLQASTGFA